MTVRDFIIFVSESPDIEVDHIAATRSDYYYKR